MASWQVGEAKERFSELLQEAHEHGAQFISENGTESAVVLSVAEYRQLHSDVPNVKDLLFSGPKTEDFKIVRDPGWDREIDL